MKNLIKYSFFLFLLSISCAHAQPFEKGKKFNRLSVGLTGVHLYDVLNSGQQLNDAGVPVLDMKGMNGDKSKFDLGLGMDLSYFMSPILSFDLNYIAGSMTGADTMLNEYYKSDLNSLGLGMNVALKSSRVINYRWVPYARFSSNRMSFNSTRFWVEDDQENTTSSGTVMTWGAGLGVRYHLSNSMHLVLQSEYMTTNTNSLDGFDAGRGRDNFVQTKLGVRYSIGKNVHRDRSAAWQGSVSRDEFTELQKESQNSVKRVENAVGEVITRTEKAEQKIEEVDRNVKRLSDDTKSKFDAIEASRLAAEVKDEMPSESFVYFELGSARIRKEQEPSLQSIISTMNANPGYFVRLTPYTDPKGLAALNVGLRSRRERAVKDYLIRNGVVASRILSGSWPGTHSGDNERDRRVTCTFTK